MIRAAATLVETMTASARGEVPILSWTLQDASGTKYPQILNSIELSTGFHLVAILEDETHINMQKNSLSSIPDS